MSMIDEATVAAVGNEFTPCATGAVYCMTMYAVMNERAVSLKGIAQPVRVVSVDWQT
jgi:hypothetical protein